MVITVYSTGALKEVGTELACRGIPNKIDKPVYQPTCLPMLVDRIGILLINTRACSCISLCN